jgi:CPA1 family monovalent cation:H+ antiporter
MSINLYSIFTLLIVLTALFSYINFRFIKLPPTIGMMLISLVCSLLLLFTGKFFPAVVEQPVSIIKSIDFQTLLMRAMLSFLLFAGAIHIDVGKLKQDIIPIASYAVFGVLISTAIIGVAMYLIFVLFHLPVPLIYCFLFGALISPTDPVSVLGILKDAKIPPSLEIKIAGESLFNDGVGVVVFISILEITITGTDNLSAWQIGISFLREAGGGLIWGIMLGYAGYWLLRSIDQYQVEVLITIALVMGGYLLAEHLHVSGPLAMVAAGIITGNKGRQEAMSDTTRDYVSKFWELLDDMLNALLFLLIGLEMLVFSFDQRTIWIGLLSILIVLFARLVSVFLPTLFLSFRKSFERNLIPILTWGGLRGGISVALALSLPASEYRSIFIPITYVIVVFSILVQGLTIGKLARKLSARSQEI